MKIDSIKFFFAIAIALLFGFICEIIAPTTGGRNWISLGIGALTTFAGLLPAIGLSYANAQRGVSIKVTAWALTLILLATNIIFSCFEYKTDIYLVAVLFLVVIGWSVIYCMYSVKSAKK